MKEVNMRKLFNVSFLEYSVLEFISRNICQHLTNWMSWNKSQEVWSNPNLLFVWYDVFVTVCVIVAKTPYFFSRQGMWSKIMSCCVWSLICLVIFSSHSKHSTCENEWASDKENVWELHVSTPYEFLIIFDSLPYIFCKVDLYIAITLYITVTFPFPRGDHCTQVWL